MLIKLLICYSIACNVISFIAFGIDKRRAVREKWRISERTLILLALIGGSLGALAGMRLFHHKTRKYKFKIGIPVILVIHILLVFVFWNG